LLIAAFGKKSTDEMKVGCSCFFLSGYQCPLLHIKICFQKTNLYMRTITLLFASLVIGTAAAKAQTMATFESLSLAHADTFYVNYSDPGNDVGFNNGLAHFPCYYDTSWGGFWDHGFAYSNMTDSVTSGFMNQYSAKTAIGYDSSEKYAVAYGAVNLVKLTGIALSAPVRGFYVTNSTYAYNSMRDGDGFARRFHNGDYFKLTVRGYRSGVLQPDSVGTYLANFLHPDTTMNYILKTWEWVNVLPLGPVDSLQFTLTSTDNGTFGMNTPAYFCIDNFTTNEVSLGAATVPTTAKVAKVYPNPATDVLYIDETDETITQIDVLDMRGNVVATTQCTGRKTAISTAALPVGTYLLQLKGSGKAATMRFIKG
jgi:hypothetical protein